LKPIKVIILFLWQEFFSKIRNFILIPFFVYFIVFIVYVTRVYEVQDGIRNRDNEDLNNEYSRRLDLGFAIVILTFIAGFLTLELKQLITDGLEYF
jgi:Ca2+/Na+ antiporter